MLPANTALQFWWQGATAASDNYNHAWTIAASSCEAASSETKNPRANHARSKLFSHKLEPTVIWQTPQATTTTSHRRCSIGCAGSNGFADNQQPVCLLTQFATESMFLKTQQATTKIGYRLASRYPIVGCRHVLRIMLMDISGSPLVHLTYTPPHLQLGTCV